MIFYIFLTLVGTGILTILYQSMRFQKILTALGGAVLGAILFAVYQAVHSQKFTDYSFKWLTSKYYPVNIDFIADKINYVVITFFIISALLNIIYMIYDINERKKVFVLSVSLLGLAFLILLICSQNTLQLLISICFIDVLGFCLINNIMARRRYIYYNLITNMILFMAFAILWGDCHTNILVKLSQCHAQTNSLAFIMIAIASIAKSGLFPFQGYILPITQLTVSRRNIISFILTPVVGYLIIYKMYPVFPLYLENAQFLKFIIIASIVWNIIGALCIKKIENKKQYLILIFYSFAYSVLLANEGNMPVSIGLLFLINIGLINTLKMGLRRLWFVFVSSIIQLSVLITIADNVVPTILGYVYLASTIIIISNIIWELTVSDREEKRIISSLLAMASSLGIAYYYQSFSDNLIYWLAIYLLLTVLKPYRYLRAINQSAKIQQTQGVSGMFYTLIVEPIEFLGRILLVTIDFLFIEKTILSSLSKINLFLTAFFNKLHNTSLINIIFFILVGIIIIICSMLKG